MGIKSVQFSIDEDMAKRKNDTGKTWREILYLGIKFAEKEKEEEPRKQKKTGIIDSQEESNEPRTEN